MGNIHGWQIAFFIFAVELLAVPASYGFVRLFDLAGPTQKFTERIFAFLVALVIVGAFPAVRREALALLRVPLPSGRLWETTIVSTAKLGMSFASFGAIALWILSSQGSEALRSLFAAGTEDPYLRAFSTHNMALMLLFAGVLAPVIEEVVMRGFLQSAWERRWGWTRATLMTSLVFGLYHSHPVSAFVSGIIFSCLYRRTGSLIAPIACHMIYNATLWHPILGQFVIPSPEKPYADLSTWWLHLACLAIAAVAVPAYFILAARSPTRTTDVPTTVLRTA